LNEQGVKLDMSRQPVDPATSPTSQAPRSFASQVSLITRLLRKRFDERARGLALPDGEVLTRAQWRMLAIIHLQEGATQREIAERLEIGAVAAGQTIDRLEESRWVERRTDPADRRVRRLYVTQAAMPLLAELGLLADSEDQRAVLGISNDDMAQLTRLLDDVIRNLMKT
jgi:MarR family transcriptional regulator for hemolysin